MGRNLITKGLMIVIAAASVSVAQMKIGFINSEKIFAQYEGTKTAQEMFNAEVARWEQEASQMQREIRELQEQLEKQSLLLSDSRKREIENQLRQKMIRYQEFIQQKFGQEGEALVKNEELTKPIIERINVIISDIARDENYDFIFDARAGGIVHAKSQYDLSDRVLEILNRGQ
ncbi:Outer membrane protein H precursor [Chitinispirillum alkaliphilum]|nr:Outer membrane protein H precursor [Chitinispirillum alkaliphilum]